MAPETQRRVSLLGLASILLKHRKLVLSVIVVFTLVGLGLALLRPARYTSAAIFLPQETDQPLSGMLGMAQQFGFALPQSAGGGRSPAFYSELIQNRAILEEVVKTTRWLPTETGHERSLIEYYEVDEETAAQTLARTVELLREDVQVSSSRETGMVTLKVSSRSPVFAQTIAAQILGLLNRFDREIRVSEASAERRFAEERLEVLRRELNSAEEKLEEFLERNRNFGNSPQLEFRHNRLQRQVSMQQELYNAIAQTHEQARLEEVRNTPVITIIEEPYIAAFPDPRKRLLLLLLFGFLGVAFSILAALAKEYWEQLAIEAPAEYLALKEQWQWSGRREKAPRQGP